jgi:hypothetical protein
MARGNPAAKPIFDRMTGDGFRFAQPLLRPTIVVLVTVITALAAWSRYQRMDDEWSHP